MPRAKTWSPASAPRRRSPSSRARRSARQAVDGKGDAGGVQRADPHLRRARAPLPRRAGPRLHRRAGQAVDAADALGQAHGEGRAQDRGRARQRRSDHPQGGGHPHRSGRARPAPASHHRSQCRAQDHRYRASGFARRRVRRDRVLLRRGRGAQGQGQEGHPRPGRDLARGHPRHARGRGHSRHPRRHDLARRRGGARQGQALRFRRRRAARRLRRRHHEHCRAHVRAGDIITIDGSTGQVLAGRGPMTEPALSGEFGTLMGWADAGGTPGVRANSDTPNNAPVAPKFRAEGIGLCRTEHMFFEEDRIRAVREMILADDEKSRRAALAKLLPMQRADFVELFEIMQGLPVTIRLLDPPLHEFLPHTQPEIEEVARAMNTDPRRLADRARDLAEFNPMLGFRGCRLAIAYPEIAEMQARAIFEAAVEAEKRTGKAVGLEVMVPLIATKAEFDLVKARIDATAQSVMKETGKKLAYQVGTMIELPRACLMAGDIAKTAEFFSFGTNDLTQTTYGISRDDAAGFLGTYIAKGILEIDTFISVDRDGVGELVKMGVVRGRKTRPDIKVGICGEHGGDPASVAFCHEIGLDYVSCSPYRVPIARLAAAQAALGKTIASQA